MPPRVPGFSRVALRLQVGECVCVCVRAHVRALGETGGREVVISRKRSLPRPAGSCWPPKCLASAAWPYASILW